MSNLAIIFDLDGVLVDSKEIHFNALNLALSEIDPKFVISQDEQAKIFEGLTTNSKLEILTTLKGLDQRLHKDVWLSKQKITANLFRSIGLDQELRYLFEYIRLHNICIGVASNSIRVTLDACLDAIGVSDLVDSSLSNEDVAMPKPSPEIYNETMRILHSVPRRTIIFEDSDIGKIAAKESGAMLIPVANRSEINLELIMKAVDKLNESD